MDLKSPGRNKAMTSAIEDLEAKGRAAKQAAHRLAYLATDIKNQALHNIADDLLAEKDAILAANKTDYHTKNIVPGRDFPLEGDNIILADIRYAQEGDSNEGKKLLFKKGIDGFSKRIGFFPSPPIVRDISISAYGIVR